MKKLGLVLWAFLLTLGLSFATLAIVDSEYTVAILFFCLVIVSSYGMRVWKNIDK
jgi:hypothetical protein